MSREFAKIKSFDEYDTAVSNLNKEYQVLSLYVSDSTARDISGYIEEAKDVGTLIGAMSTYALQKNETNGIVSIAYRKFDQGEVLRRILDAEKSPIYGDEDDYGMRQHINHPFYIAHLQVKGKYNILVKSLKRELYNPVID